MNKVSNNVDQKILSDIHHRLHPHKGKLLAKIFLIHIITAVVTLALCPQFGFKTFHLPFNLMNSFMIFGMSACNFLCGLFFTTTSVVIASIILKRDEVRALKFQKLITASALVLSSIGFFGIMAPDFFLEISLLWVLGAMIGTIVTLEVSWKILLVSNGSQG